MVTSELTPQERLGLSRKAILKHMNRHQKGQRDNGALAHSGDDSEEAFSGNQHKSSTLEVLKHALWVWWQRNPASAAVELAQPLVHDYAKAHPYKLLGVSAAVGAGVVILKPWRLISVGALIGATLKSSGLSHAVFSLLASSSGDAKPSGTKA